MNDASDFSIMIVEAAASAAADSTIGIDSYRITSEEPDVTIHSVANRADDSTSGLEADANTSASSESIDLCGTLRPEFRQFLPKTA